MAHEQDRHYSCILDHIHGVVFFGTPHRGSSLAAWDEIGTLIVKASTLGYATNSKLSSSLKVDSKFLRRISESFAARGEDFEVRSFYENLRMKGLNCKVSWSARHHKPLYQVVWVETDSETSGRREGIGHIELA